MKTLGTRRDGLESLKRKTSEKRQSWDSPGSPLTPGNDLKLQDASVDGIYATHVHKRLNMGVCVSESPIV